jgi:hypothetical protein
MVTNFYADIILHTRFQAAAEVFLSWRGGDVYE